MAVLLKVWCLPAEMQEGDFQSLFQELLSALKNVSDKIVRNEKDVTILFPTDRMQWGLGQDIVAEADCLFYSSSVESVDHVRIDLAEKIAHTLKKRFPKATVRSFARKPMSWPVVETL
ncbi:MAG: hypothetical protein WC514_02520 [Candidatus Paceibacterota bacterium]